MRSVDIKLWPPNQRSAAPLTCYALDHPVLLGLWSGLALGAWGIAMLDFEAWFCGVIAIRDVRLRLVVVARPKRLGAEEGTPAPLRVTLAATH